MTALERDIKAFLLKALLAAGGEPITDETLKGAVVNSWRHIAFTGTDLTRYIRDCESDQLISGTNDEVAGLVWTLTLKGKTRAQQLR